MKIELTTKEYLTLLKSVYLADCVANSHAQAEEEEHRDISRLRRKIFSLAAGQGFGELVRHDPVGNDYFETDELAEEIDSEFMARHIDAIFWREMIARFTDKIMDDRFGAEMGGWTKATYDKRRAKIEKKVETELLANGLSNVFLLGDFSD
jgi:hypothetical protein